MKRGWLYSDASGSGVCLVNMGQFGLDQWDERMWPRRLWSECHCASSNMLLWDYHWNETVAVSFNSCSGTDDAFRCVHNERWELSNLVASDKQTSPNVHQGLYTFHCFGFVSARRPHLSFGLNTWRQNHVVSAYGMYFSMVEQDKKSIAKVNFSAWYIWSKRGCFWLM